MAHIKLWKRIGKNSLKHSFGYWLFGIEAQYLAVCPEHEAPRHDVVGFPKATPYPAASPNRKPVFPNLSSNSSSRPITSTSQTKPMRSSNNGEVSEAGYQVEQAKFAPCRERRGQKPATLR
jgi:hypothetical protein